MNIKVMSFDEWLETEDGRDAKQAIDRLDSPARGNMHHALCSVFYAAKAIGRNEMHEVTNNAIKEALPS